MRFRKALRRYPRRRFHRRGGRHDNTNKSRTQTERSRIKGGVVSLDKASVKLPYRFTNSFTQNAGTVGSYGFKHNSIFDCGAAADTENAQGYARYYSLYTRSLVRASSISISFWNDSAGDQEPCIVAVIPCNSTQLSALATITSPDAVINQPHCKSKTYFPGQKAFLRHYAHVQTLLTGTDTTDLTTSTQFSSTIGSDPTQTTSWFIAFFGMAGNTAQNWQIDIRITYYCDFYQPIVLTTQSLTQRGNDFNGTPEEYEEYKKKWNLIPVKLPPAKEYQEEKKESSDYELIRVPKAKVQTPASSSKK